MELNNELIRSLGMTLIHSLWEGLVVLALILFGITLAGRANARLRYTLQVSGLMLLLAGFFVTWYMVYQRNIHSQQIFTLASVINLPTRQLLPSTPWSFETAGIASLVHHRLEPFYPTLAMGWILGFIFMFLRMAGGLYFSRQIIRKKVFAPDPSILDLFDSARKKLGMPSLLKLRLTTRLISPMVIGILKPCVIMPVAILSGLTPGQVEAILIHELAHIRRFDHIVMIFQAVATQILFFHPVAWYLSGEINHERENCCDDIVMNTFSDPINYIKALTMIQEMNVGGPVPANALTGRSKSLLSRVKRLLKPETKHSPAFRLAVVFLLLITLGIAAVTIASTGKLKDSTIITGLFSGRTDRTQAAQDTIKTRADKPESQKNKSTGQADEKKKKELAEASYKLEKVRQELEKVQRELEKAQKQVELARKKLGSGDLASLNDEIRRATDKELMHQFMMDRDGEFQDHYKQLNEEMNRVQKEVQMHMQQFRQEDWTRFQEEWKKSGSEMKKAMEDFYRSRKDSAEFFHGPHFFHVPPFPPCIPPVPHIPEVAHPEIPDIEAIPPEQDQQPELMQQDQKQMDKEKAESLELKLREAEKSKE
jgi:beta-lactamase regulating signal transducer with metallopeptidase domain